MMVHTSIMKWKHPPNVPSPLWWFILRLWNENTPIMYHPLCDGSYFLHILHVWWRLLIGWALKRAASSVFQYVSVQEQIKEKIVQNLRGGGNESQTVRTDGILPVTNTQNCLAPYFLFSAVTNASKHLKKRNTPYKQKRKIAPQE